jgi:hypothetical protein
MIYLVRESARCVLFAGEFGNDRPIHLAACGVLLPDGPKAVGSTADPESESASSLISSSSTFVIVALSFVAILGFS